MTPKVYGFLWIFVFFFSGILYLAGALTLLTGVAFGFVAFGMVFMGMMCVLPGTVSHPVAKKEKPAATPARVPRQKVEKRSAAPAGFSAYRSV